MNNDAMNAWIRARGRRPLAGPTASKPASAATCRNLTVLQHCNTATLQRNRVSQRPSLWRPQDGRVWTAASRCRGPVRTAMHAARQPWQRSRSEAGMRDTLMPFSSVQSVQGGGRMAVEAASAALEPRYRGH